MRLLLKFNLVFVLVFALGLAATGYVSWRLLERNARDEIAQNARLLMDAALSTRSYTGSQVGPLLQTQMKYTFLPQSLPAYAAAETFSDLRHQYSYKEAARPANPRNRAVDWKSTSSPSSATTRTSRRSSATAKPTGRSFMWPTDARRQSCRRATRDLPRQSARGPANGFGWILNDVIAAQIISVPTAIPVGRAKAFTVFEARSARSSS
jgi:protein-histidine pros-kinase